MRQRVRYAGRVQGVGFRATTRELMRRHPVSGWVRNEPDGSVLLEVQGMQQAVEVALAELRRVMERNIESEDPAEIGEVEGEAGFEIVY